jgi:hypothetical protein
LTKNEKYARMVRFVNSDKSNFKNNYNKGVIIVKKSILALILAVVFVVPFISFAEDNNPKKIEITGTLSETYLNAYIGGTPGSIVYDHPVLQSDLEIDLAIKETVFYLELWHSYSPNGGENNDWGDEIDYIAGIKKKIGEFSFDVNFSYFNFADMKNMKGDLYSVNFNADFPKILEVTPYLTIEGDIPKDKKILEGGVAYRIGTKYSPKLFGQPIDMDLSIGGHDGAYGTRKEIVSSVRGVLSSTFTFKTVNITPQISYQKRVGYSVEHGGLTENKFWYGITMSIPFTVYQKK